MSKTPECAVGMERIGRGLYVDAGEALHVDPEEVCRAHGYAPSAENCEMLERVLLENWRDLGLSKKPESVED
jgi:hypothetical protein